MTVSSSPKKSPSENNEEKDVSQSTNMTQSHIARREPHSKSASLPSNLSSSFSAALQHLETVSAKNELHTLDNFEKQEQPQKEEQPMMGTTKTNAVTAAAAGRTKTNLVVGHHDNESKISNQNQNESGTLKSLARVTSGEQREHMRKGNGERYVPQSSGDPVANEKDALVSNVSTKVTTRNVDESPAQHRDLDHVSPSSSSSFNGDFVNHENYHPTTSSSSSSSSTGSLERTSQTRIMDNNSSSSGTQTSTRTKSHNSSTITPASTASTITIQHHDFSSHAPRSSRNESHVSTSTITTAAADTTTISEQTHTNHHHHHHTAAAASTTTTDLSQPRTLVTDLQAHLDNEEISDVQLMGTDTKIVYAVRSILAMRSRFFKSLFYGNFRERTSPQVRLNYSSLVLKAVVEYCYTDEIKTAFENLSFEETARAMVGLVSAGNYFELQGLMSRAYRLTCLMMDEYPALACAVLDESLEKSRDFGHGELSRVALGIIRLRTESSLMPPDAHAYGLGVQSLGPRAMERVMAMKVEECATTGTSKIRTSELSLFLCLQKWAKGGIMSGGNDEDRFPMAQQMASKIDLKRILPSDLSTHVANSGLVTIEQLAEAYREQALQAERQGMLFSTTVYPSTAIRRTTNNKSSNNDGADSVTSATTAISGQVMVQGAGLEAVNGTYKSQRSSGRYSRYGVIPGCGKGEFFLHISRLQDDTKKWFLSFRGCGYYFDLYAAPSEAIAATTTSTNSSSSDVSSSTSSVYNYNNHWGDDDPPPMQKWLAVAPGHAQLRTLWRKTNNNYYYSDHGSGFEAGSGGTFKPKKEQGDSADGTAGDPPPICIWIPDEP